MIVSPEFIYKFYLDDTKVSNPDGWDEMITTIKRDKDLKGVFVNMDVTFVFSDDGYDFIKDVYDQTNYCADIELRIEQSRDAGGNFAPFYTGIIKISDVEFEYKTQTAKTKVLDDSFFAKIYNRKTTEASVTAGKSINDNTIPIPPTYTVQMFEPQTGGVVSPGAGDATAKFYKPYDLFKYLVAFMTDDEVDFDSTLYGTGGEREYSMMTFGKVIRKVQSGYAQGDFELDIPILVFQKLFQELDRKENLGLFIDNSKGKPILRIEKWDDLFKKTVSQKISNIDVLKERISTDDIYSSLKIGCNNTLDSLALQFNEQTQFLGFASENYNIVGKCAIDRTLDLTTDFIVSSNIIEQILINNTGDTSYDKDWFIVDCVLDGVIKAVKTNWLITAPPYFYNEYFINANVAKRYLNAIPNSIAKYLVNADYRFRAELTTDLSFSGRSTFTESPVTFDDDFTPPNSDVSNVYGSGTIQGDPVTKANSKFTAKRSGIYVLESEIDIEGISFTKPDYTLQFFYSVFGQPPPFFIDGETITYSTGTAVIYKVNGLGSLYLTNVTNPAGVNTLALTFTGNTSGATGTVTGAKLQPYNVFPNGRFFVIMNRFDIGNNLIETIANNGYDFAVGAITDSVIKTVSMNAGDYVIRQLKIVNSDTGIINLAWKIKAGSYFACTEASGNNNVFQFYDPADYPIIKDSFETEIDSWRFDPILNDPLSLIQFSRLSTDFINGWTEEIRFDHKKQNGSFILLSSKNSR